MDPASTPFVILLVVIAIAAVVAFILWIVEAGFGLSIDHLWWHVQSSGEQLCETARERWRTAQLERIHQGRPNWPNR